MSYTPKEWACGDTITAEELNRMEQGIVEAGQGGGGSSVVVSPNGRTEQDGNRTYYYTDTTAEELINAINGGALVAMDVNGKLYYLSSYTITGNEIEGEVQSFNHSPSSWNFADYNGYICGYYEAQQ